ncbi:hypothetical protein PHMEG_00033973, partial [Phytophthora megakarya]
MYVYDVQLGIISSVLGVSEKSLTRWYRRFNETGNVDKKASKLRTELVQCLDMRHYVSDATICRALKFDLGLTRKVLTKRATESLPRERDGFVRRLAPYYRRPDQLVFVDEPCKAI